MLRLNKPLEKIKHFGLQQRSDMRHGIYDPQILRMPLSDFAGELLCPLAPYEGRDTQVLRADQFLRRVRKSRRKPREITVFKLDGTYYSILMFPYEDRH